MKNFKQESEFTRCFFSSFSSKLPFRSNAAFMFDPLYETETMPMRKKQKENDKERKTDGEGQWET